MKQLPGPQGLYHPSNEHDSCGVAFVVDMKGRRSRDIVEKAITALVNLEHRGAAGSEPNTGDGAGILLQVPDKFFRAVVDFPLPAEGTYATGIAFLPQSKADAQRAAEAVEKIVESEGLKVLGWREVATDDSSLAPWPATPCRRSGRSSSAARTTPSPAWTSNAAPTSSVSAPSTNWAVKAQARTAPVARPCTSRACRARRSSTRACSPPRSSRFLPGPAGRAPRVGPRPRALALLHQHVPVVAAGPPVPARGPQR